MSRRIAKWVVHFKGEALGTQSVYETMGTLTMGMGTLTMGTLCWVENALRFCSNYPDHRF